MASATDSLKSSSVTSPLTTRDVPGSAAATDFRSRSVRATSATEAPACEKACASRAPSPRLAPVMTTRLPETAPGPGNDSGISICSIIVSLTLYRPVQYTFDDRRFPGSPALFAGRPARDAAQDVAHPRLRGAGGRALPGRRGPRFRPPLHRAGSDRRRRLLAAGRGRRHHVDPPRPRPLSGQGPGAGRHVRRADGQGPGHESGAWRLHAHRRPEARDLRRQRHCGRRRADRGGGRHRRATPRRRHRHRGLLRRRRGGAGRLPRGVEPRLRLEAAGRLLLREQWLCRVLPGFHPTCGVTRAPGGRLRHSLRRGGRQRRGGDGVPHGPGRRQGPRRRRALRGGGRDLPLARALRGRS